MLFVLKENVNTFYDRVSVTNAKSQQTLERNSERTELDISSLAI